MNLVTLRSAEHSVAGTLSGPRSEPRIVLVDDHAVEVPPAEHMLVVRNDDRPGMIGVVGTALGEAGVSISSMAVGPVCEPATRRSWCCPPNGGYPTTLSTLLRAADGILDIHRITSV